MGKRKKRKERIDKAVNEQRKKAKNFLGDFKKFISKGNVVDLATAVVIGTAFNKIVNGLVNFIITPLISLMIDGIDMTAWKYVIREEVLDEAGEEMRSVAFAQWVQKRMNSGVRRLVLMIGGPYGFSEAVYARANSKISLSKMTFSHQIVRAIFTEQLYRAFTIIKGEPYHHE